MKFIDSKIHDLKQSKGYSIVEMLIAVGLFAIIGVVVTGSLASSFKNSKKSTSISNVKLNLEYTLSTMERLLRNSAGVLPSSSSTNVLYQDEYGNTTSLSCIPVPSVTQGYIASGSAGTIKLTSDEVHIDCSAGVFSYPPSPPGVPHIIEIKLTGIDKNSGTTAEGSKVTAKTRVLLRNYLD